MKPPSTSLGTTPLDTRVDATSHSKLGDLMVLAKVRLNALVVATTAGGYYMAAPLDIDPLALALACGGTALVASGAAAINQVVGAVRRLMERTRRRPMAEGRMRRPKASCGRPDVDRGLAILVFAANLLAAGIALATLLTYVVVYTPMKRYSSLATVVGAVPGALPPLIGWAAARGSIAGIAPWSLFLIMFIWQLPHFLAIAWITAKTTPAPECRCSPSSTGMAP